MVKVLVHHAEIGLKGGNFTYFEKVLVKNIKKLSKREDLKLKDIERQDKRIICKFDSTEKKISENLKCVFPILYQYVFSRCVSQHLPLRFVTLSCGAPMGCPSPQSSKKPRRTRIRTESAGLLSHRPAPGIALAYFNRYW